MHYTKQCQKGKSPLQTQTSTVMSAIKIREIKNKVKYN